MPDYHGQPEIPEFYVALYRPTPEKPGTESQQLQTRDAHIANQRRHYEEGRLVMGGPFPNGEGGMALFKAQDLAEAQALVAADPAVAAGIYQVEIYRYRVMLSAWEL